MLTYNPTHRGEWSFSGMHQLINSSSTSERHTFFSHTLPGIIHLALDLPILFANKTIPLLLPSSPHSKVILSQHQIASLLANAFLCTFPRRNKPPKSNKHSSHSIISSPFLSSSSRMESLEHMPSINFSGLFGKTGSVVVNKLRCILNYFNRIVCTLVFNYFMCIVYLFYYLYYLDR